MPIIRRILLLSLALAVTSCGKSNEEKSGPGSEGRNEAPESVVKDSLILEENCGFWPDCDFIVRSDLSQRPVTLFADFRDNGSEKGNTGQCRFEVTLSETEAVTLRSLVQSLRICRRKNFSTEEEGFDGLFTTDTSGAEVMVHKFPESSGPESEMNYLCGGRSAFYSYLEKLIVPRAPAECPSGYKLLFR